MTTPRLVRLSLSAWLGSLLLVILACAASLKIPWAGGTPKFYHPALSRLASNYDGGWYELIASQGYAFSTTRRSDIVFFPGYPLLARAVHSLGVPLHLAMLLTSNLLLAGAFVVFALYVRDRIVGDDAEQCRWFALLALALLPSTIFFHLAYTESLTLLTMLLAMYGMHRRWHPVLVAGVIGAATAARSTGVALLLPFAWYLWQWTKAPVRDRSGVLVPPTGSQRVVRFLSWTPVGVLACWGLIGFMIYQQVHFGAPLAFMRAQMVWGLRKPVTNPVHRLINLMDGESIWSAFLPGAALYWNRYSCRNVPLLNLYFMNPIYFVGTAVLVIMGRHRRWISTPELLLSGMLLAIPYLAQSNRQGMVSEARFTSIVFPAYLVMGHLLAKMPRRGAYVLLAISAVFMFSYAALFCANYPFY